jgi:malate/lactate dehydrogenase
MRSFGVTIIGAAGNVGTAISFGLLWGEMLVSNLDLIDIDDKKLQGEISDLRQAIEIKGLPRMKIESIIDPRESDFYVICAGKSSDNRESLYETNLPIINHYMAKIAEVRKEDSIVLMVTNPSTRLTKVALDYVPYVIPIGNMLDNARLRLCKVNGSHEKPDIQKKYLETKNGKGYSNWAVSTEVISVIHDFIYGKT